MNKKVKLSVVVPCYNEAENLPALLKAYDKAVQSEDVEVIVVNNGSTDETPNILETLTPQYQRFLTIKTVPINQGYGFGILAGLAIAKGEFIGWTHGDLQTPPENIISALNLIKENTPSTNLFIKGKRIGRPLTDRFFTLGMSVFETIFLRTKLYDINAQPNIFHRDFFKIWGHPPYDFSLDLYALYMAKKSNLKIIRFTVPFLPRQHGTSKWNTGLLSKYKFIKRTISFSFSLKNQLDKHVQ